MKKWSERHASVTFMAVQHQWSFGVDIKNGSV